MENAENKTTFVTSFHDVLEQVLRVLLKPNLKIGLGSGKIIDSLVEWLLKNAETNLFSGLSVFCTEQRQVQLLKNRGIDAQFGLPDETGEWNHQLDYYFEMPDCMNQNFHFVKLNSHCELYKKFFKHAQQCIFFYHYTDGQRFSPFTTIPLEISPKYQASLKRHFTTPITCVESTPPSEEDDDIVRINLLLTSNLQKHNWEGCDLSSFTRCLKGTHGLISHGLFTEVHGFLIDISEQRSDEMYMSLTPLS